MNDGLEPKNSNDHTIPRFTWWDHRGSAEWVQYDFGKPRKVSAVEVYWFDDTGIGQLPRPGLLEAALQGGRELEAGAKTPPNSPSSWTPTTASRFKPVQTTGPAPRSPAPA